MNDIDRNKQVIRKYIQVVWQEGNLNALPNFWTEDCINHATPTADRGLDRLRIYHESFLRDFSAFSDIQIDIQQQVAEGDRVVSYLTTRGRHSGTFFGISPTDKTVVTSVIRIDRLESQKIAEHWSVSDAASLIQQLQS
jgi:predicted ester cyclase